MNELEFTPAEKQILFSSLGYRVAELLGVIAKTHDYEVKRILKQPLFETIRLFEKISNKTLSTMHALNLPPVIYTEYTSWRTQKEGTKNVLQSAD